MRPKKLSIILILISLVLLPTTPALAASPAAEDIAKQLICQCGCGMVLSNCTHIECSSKIEMTALLEQKLSQGQSEAEIIQFFVAQYGEQVLASPPKKGFNLVAWILPFAAILVGGIVIYLAVKAWVRRGTRSAASSKLEEGDEKYQEQLEKELEEFSEGGFR